MKFIYSELSKTGKIPENTPKLKVLADALGDWGCVMAGAPMPGNFGQGMAAASQALKVSATPENLDKLYNQYKKNGTL